MPIYLDYNATVPIRPAARAAVVAALDVVGNPSSVHRFGREARRALEDARESVAALVGAAPAEVVFTSGGTEANNLALRGSGRQRILVSALEHPSVAAAVPEAEVIPAGPDGVVDLAALETMLRDDGRPALVSVMLANNETGGIQPVAAVAEIARRAGALVHCDAVQAAGRLPIDVHALGLDYLSISGHKLGGPPGVGALVCAGEAPLAAVALGGGQERRRRGGTENVAGVVGFGAAAAEAYSDIADQPRLAGLRDRLEADIAAIAPEAPVFGKAAPRLANTSCIGLPGMRAETQVMAFDLEGIAVSAGAACSSGKVSASPVLLAMGVDPTQAACAIRVSLGWQTREEDVTAFVRAWAALYRRRTARAA